SDQCAPADLRLARAAGLPAAQQTGHRPDSLTPPSNDLVPGWNRMPASNVVEAASNGVSDGSEELDGRRHVIGAWADCGGRRKADHHSPGLLFGGPVLCCEVFRFRGRDMGAR